MSPAPELQGFQRRHLRARAHALKPVVQVGDGGVSDAVIRAVDDALGRHELIKVRLQTPADKKSTAGELAARTASALCGILGHTVVLYRPDPVSPKIELPKRA
jgi:RNA-binding protein